MKFKETGAHKSFALEVWMSSNILMCEETECHEVNPLLVMVSEVGGLDAWNGEETKRLLSMIDHWPIVL